MLLVIFTTWFCLVDSGKTWTCT